MARNDKQKRFVAEYLKDLNATQAAIRAGYSPRTARAQASQLLTKPNIAAAVEAGAKRVTDKAEIDATEVLREMKRLAMVDVGLAFDDSGFMLPLKDIPEDIRRAIVGLEVSEIFAGDGDQKSIIGHLKKVKFADKKGALDSLMKHLGIAGADKLEHAGKDGEPLTIHIDLG